MKLSTPRRVAVPFIVLTTLACNSGCRTTLNDANRPVGTQADWPMDGPAGAQDNANTTTNASVNAGTQVSMNATAQSSEMLASTSARSLRISGIQADGGPVRVAIFNSATAFPDHEQADQKLSFVSPHATAAQAPVEDLPATPFAVAVYQDLNNDGRLNRGMFGIPAEPYGFSNGAMGSMGPPSFEAAAVSPVAPSQQSSEIEIKLNQVK